MSCKGQRQNKHMHYVQYTSYNVQVWVLNRSFCLNKPYLALCKRQRRVEVVHRSFLFSVQVAKHVPVWQTIICLKQESQTTSYICLYLQIIWYPIQYICLHVCSSPWTQYGGFFYIFGNPLKVQNLVYCVGQIQLIFLVMWDCLKPV